MNLAGSQSAKYLSPEGENGDTATASIGNIIEWGTYEVRASLVAQATALGQAGVIEANNQVAVVSQPLTGFANTNADHDKLRQMFLGGESIPSNAAQVPRRLLHPTNSRQAFSGQWSESVSLQVKSSVRVALERVRVILKR